MEKQMEVIVTCERIGQGPIGRVHSFSTWEDARTYITRQCDGRLPKERAVASSELGETAFRSNTLTFTYGHGDLLFTAEGPADDFTPA